MSAILTRHLPHLENFFLQLDNSQLAIVIGYYNSEASLEFDNSSALTSGSTQFTWDNYVMVGADKITLATDDSFASGFTDNSTGYGFTLSSNASLGIAVHTLQQTGVNSFVWDSIAHFASTYGIDGTNGTSTNGTSTNGTSTNSTDSTNGTDSSYASLTSAALPLTILAALMALFA